MHANKREEIEEVYAGDICAVVGLKSVNTGDTLCDENKQVILESIEFPAPGPEERRELWHAHLGTNHRLDAAAINQLAVTVDLVGGHVRNAVLAAAVLARAARRLIEFDDVVEGLLIEYRKLGRSAPSELQARRRS